MCKETVVVFASELGSAKWSCMPHNKKAKGSFTVSSIQLLGATKLNLHFEHVFFSHTQSDVENAKDIENLASILKSVGAVDIKPTVNKVTPVAQFIIVSYEIPDVPIPGVDKLTTAIAKVCKDLIIKLSLIE